MTVPRLHIVDGTFELFRAHFSKRPGHTSPQGKDLKATLGVVSSLLWLLEDPNEQCTHLAVAFDNPIRSFRNDLFAGYKSDEGVPPELLAQFDDVEQAVRALGVTVWSMKEFEADDAMAAGAAKFASEVEQIRLLTPDKDVQQCVRGTQIVTVDRIRERVIDEAGVLAGKGVLPRSIPDLLALIGDDADGIPGLPGWGEKSAATVLRAYEHLEHIPDDARRWTVQPRSAEKLAATLREERPAALLYRTLATLRTDVPLAEDLEALRFQGVPKAGFLEWCAAVGTTSLPERPRRWLTP